MEAITKQVAKELGVSPLSMGIAIVIVVLTGCFSIYMFAPTVDGELPNGIKVALHPNQLKYMKEKEKDYCSGDFGKGLRCIYDYLREEDDETIINAILNEPPKYTDEQDYESHYMHVHLPQFEFFAKRGVTISTVEGEEFKELSRISRALLDWAIRKEQEGDSQDRILFQLIRCVNC